MPSFLSTSHCEFYDARCATTHDEPSLHARFAHLLENWYLRCSLFEESITQSSSAILLKWPYKVLPFTTKILRGSRFFLYFFLSFSLHIFSWACRSLREPRKFFSNSLFVHSLVCILTHSFLHGFQSKLYQHFSHVCSTCHTVFSLK